MGNNQVQLCNETGHAVRCLTFNNSDIVYWIPRDYVQLPVTGEPVTVDGLQGGGAVKVGIIYNEDFDEGRSYFDLFQLDHGTTLHITELTEDGVRKCHATDGQLRLLDQGMSIVDPNVQLKAQAILQNSAS